MYTDKLATTYSCVRIVCSLSPSVERGTVRWCVVLCREGVSFCREVCSPIGISSPSVERVCPSVERVCPFIEALCKYGGGCLVVQSVDLVTTYI